MLITFSALAAFFAVVVAVLYISHKRSTVSSFSNYAVGSRSFSSWFVSMAYTNSWWPGSTFTVFFGLGISAGILGLYALVYSTLGVLAMYFIARPVWKWGKKFDLRTQSDLLQLRYNTRGIKTVSSVITIVALFPWLVLGLQAMGNIIFWASLGKMSVTTSLLIGVIVIAVRQLWTVQMGMRGLIITDMVQGIVAYIGSAILCIGLIVWYFNGLSDVSNLPSSALSLPGFDSAVGGWYYFSIVAAGIIGSLCWPMIFSRIYTAASVREVKKGAVQTMGISILFYGLLMLVALAAIPTFGASATPNSAWFEMNISAGGTWLLAVALVVMFAATMGFVDGVVQAMGTQLSNDVIGPMRKLTDKQEIITAKAGMVVFVLAGVWVAYATYSYANLVNLAQMAYQIIVQLAVPLFVGLFWRRGNGVAALLGMVIGIVITLTLTLRYFSTAGSIPWLEGLEAGLIGLAANLAVYVVWSYVKPSNSTEQARVDDLFAQIHERIPFVSSEDAAARATAPGPGPVVEPSL